MPQKSACMYSTGHNETGQICEILGVFKPSNYFYKSLLHCEQISLFVKCLRAPENDRSQTRRGRNALRVHARKAGRACVVGEPEKQSIIHDDERHVVNHPPTRGGDH